MDSWSYERSVFMGNDSFAQSRTVIAGFDQRHCNGLENGDDDDVFMSKAISFADITKVASSSSSSDLLPLEMENQPMFSSVATKELDFKLKSFFDYGNTSTSSRAFALPAKKPRASNTSTEKPLCQVYGCNMDLSFSKDYHKRHRVCEAHSKTSVVVVSGIEQRFCQQCSRFHFLSEFDDGKRSCRRRLAGHNERRRKPSFYFLPSHKRNKLLPTSQGVVGNKFPLVLPESFPGNLLYRVVDEDDQRASRLVSFKDEPTRSTFYEAKPGVYPPEAPGVCSDWDLHETASRPTCALSLLSAQSQQHFSEIPTTTFSITNPSHKMEPLWIDRGKINSGSSSCTGKRSSTVDLLQLSSHLQRIEQQRNITDEVKQEHNKLYFPCS